MTTDVRPQRGTEEYARQYLDRVTAGYYRGKSSNIDYPRKQAVVSTRELAALSPAVRSHVEAAIAVAEAEHQAALAAYEAAAAEERALQNDIARVEREDRWHWLRVVHGVTDLECPFIQAIFQAANSLWLDFDKASRGDIDKWVDTMLGSLYTPEMRALLRTPATKDELAALLSRPEFGAAPQAERGMLLANVRGWLVQAYKEHMPAWSREHVLPRPTTPEV